MNIKKKKNRSSTTDILLDGQMFHFSMVNSTGKFPMIFDQLEHTLCPSYVLKVNENYTCTSSLICPCHWPSTL